MAASFVKFYGDLWIYFVEINHTKDPCAFKVYTKNERRYRYTHLQR